MNYPVRFLQTGFAKAAWNMALDQAILEAIAKGDSPATLRFYGWSPAAVSLGYFQSAAEELDLEACAGAGVDVVRRITGGGAVLHEAELTYSIAIPLTHPLASSSILDSYKVLCAAVVEGLNELGLASEFSPINDVICEGKKVSGNAQTRRLGVLLQHGTILLEVEPEKMFSLLKVPREKAQGKMPEAIKSRVTSVSSLLGRKVDFNEASRAFARGFTKALCLELQAGEPKAAEIARSSQLACEKFGSPEWNLRR